MAKGKILVTGGTGYIGSHTVVELIDAGYEPVIVDNLSNSSVRILDQIGKITGMKPRFHRIDLADEKETAAFLSGQKDISGVIHFAAFKAVGESVADPLKYYRNNFYSMINLLNGFSGKAVNFVFSS
ncbi:MAG TPA: SDR family NAD(P)-dependent oxidoreductase, partial [Sphingobacteriaceae bacterium]